MTLESASVLKAGLVLLVAAQVLPSVSGCNGALYESKINDFCLAKFMFDMGGLERGLWCSWPDTMDGSLTTWASSYAVKQRGHPEQNPFWYGRATAALTVQACWIYEGLKNCTVQVAWRLECFWPNQIVDRFFMNVHRIYFHDCALTGRLLHDPPIGILAPFIAVPVLVTLLMTALVVWRSKRTEGVL